MKKRLRMFDILRRIAPDFYQAFLRIAARKQNRPQVPDTTLSSGEKEVLKWMKAGKTTWEIATMLSISERTVKFHAQNILQKVHAVTTAQAVAISVEEGLIDVE